MRVCYVALDPGGTTGWATVEFEEMYNPLTEQLEVLDVTWHRGHIGPKAHHKQLYDFLGSLDVERFVVITESFEYRNRARAGLVLDSREYIGVTQLYCDKRGIPLIQQTAAMGKGLVKDENLKKLDLWYGTKWKHAMDATRHLIYYIINGAGVPPVLRMQVLERGFK